MENGVPTVPGSTPDSEENNNSNTKASPGPSAVIGERADTGYSTNDHSDGAKTPMSANSDALNENGGDVTIESKPAEDETTPSETPEDKGEQSQDGPTGETTSGTGKKEIIGKDDQKKDSGLGEESVEIEHKSNDKDGVDSRQPEEKAVGGNEDQAGVLYQNGQDTDLQKSTKRADDTKEKENHSAHGKMNIDAGHDEAVEKSGKSDGAMDDGSSKQHKEKQDAGDSVSPSINAEEGPKDEANAKPVESSISDGESKTEDNSAPGGIGDSESIKEGDAVGIEGVIDDTSLSNEELLTKYHATELQLDGMREENARLNARIEELEKEVKQLREGKEGANEKQRDGYRVHADYLARELSQTQNAEQFLKEKVAELLEENEEGEKKIKDLQLRLKRFAKDDKAKDERIAKMEAELKEITGIVEELETYVDEETRLKIEERRSNTRQSRPTMSAPASDTNHSKNTDINKMNTNRSYRDPEPVVRSRTCVMF